MGHINVNHRIFAGTCAPTVEYKSFCLGVGCASFIAFCSRLPSLCVGVFPIVFVALSCPSVSVGCFRWLLSQACFLARPAAAAAADVSCGCLVLMLLGLGGEPAVLLPAARVSLRPSCLRAAAVPLCLQRWPVAVLLGEQ